MTTTGFPPEAFPGGTSRPLSLPAAGSGPGPSALLDPTLQSPLNPTGEGRQGSGGIGGLVRTVKRRQSVFLVTFAVVTGFLAINTLRQRIFSPVYQGGFQMQISNPFDDASASWGGGSVERVARNEIKTDVPSLIVLMRSPLLLGPVAQSQGVPLRALEDSISIDQESAKVDNILNISLRWPDPVKGKAILRQLAKDYTAFSQTQRLAAVNSGVRFLDQQAPAIQERVQKLSQEMLKFRQRNNFVDPATAAGQILGAREGLVEQLRTLQNEQVQLDSQLKSIQTGKLQFTPSGAPSALEQLGRNSVLVPGRDSNATGVEAAKGATTPLALLNQFEQELATAKGTFKENSPIVQSLLARRNQLLPVVQRQAADAVKARLLSNIAQQDEINRQVMLLSENFRNNPQKLSEFENINQRLSIAREQYSSYIQARERYRLEMARSISPWEVIGPPDFDSSPVEPNIQRNLLRAIMIGLLAGLGAAMLRERTDNVFHTPMEVEKELQLPVLGLIPYLPLEPGVDIATSISKMSSSERFAIKESLRSLFTTFRLLRADSNIRMVGITSSTQGEGKSTAVAVFARTLADLGLKVLVVDSDMRLPMQARYLGVDQGDGFSTLLTDSSKQPSEFIHTVVENMDVLPAGPKPPDPAKLLNSSRCKEILDELRDLPGYDLIIVDAPPCLMLADPILLGEKLDGILFLVGLGKVSRDLAPQASRRIKATGVDVLGIICNQVNFPSRLNDYGYEYGYYYHYAYASASSYPKSAEPSSPEGYGSYVQRYRDSYVKGAATNSYINGRYKEGESDLKSYFQASDEAASSPSASNGGASEGVSPLNREDAAQRQRNASQEDQGPVHWLRRRFGKRS